MTVIAVKPKVFKKYKVKIGVDNYEAHVSAVTLTPSATAQNWRGADGVNHAATGDAAWTCQLDYAQDWETPNSLAIYLLNNEGLAKDVEFFPLETGPKFTATIIITPGPIGGAVDAYGTASATCGVEGRPLFTAAAVTP